MAANVSLTPVAPKCRVLESDDPYKNYWWGILLGFAAIALWLLSPMLGETSIGSGGVRAGSKQDAGIEQSLASLTKDIGEALLGGAAAASKTSPEAASRLYSAAAEGSSSGSEANNASDGAKSTASNLADELKAISQRGAGGWDEKPQRGFNAPGLSGSSLSGVSAASGGRAGTYSGTNAFGSRNAQVTFANGPELGVGSPSKGESHAVSAGAGVAALKAAATRSAEGAVSPSNDASVNSMSRVFDGAQAGSALAGPGGAASGVMASLDAAPANLKLADPKLNEKKLTPPPGVDAGASAMKDSDMAKQLAMSMVGIVIGGVVGGVVGGIVTQVVQKAVDIQEQRAQQEREIKEKEQLAKSKQRMGA